MTAHHEALLAALDEAGARTFDPAGFGLIGALLGRAERTFGGAADMLRARADARIDQLTKSFGTARARAREALATIPEEAANRAELTHALGSGDLVSVIRASKRHARRSLACSADAPRSSRHAMANTYERSFENVQAAFSVAHALDALPEASGPYNALSLAARTLVELGALSPAYLRAHVLRLEDLGALLQLPPPVTTPPGGRVRRKR